MRKLFSLTLMALDFINSIESGSSPISNAMLGVEVVKILAAAQKSIENQKK